jgi:hypothetical protein
MSAPRKLILVLAVWGLAALHAVPAGAHNGGGDIYGISIPFGAVCDVVFPSAELRTADCSSSATVPLLTTVGSGRDDTENAYLLTFGFPSSLEFELDYRDDCDELGRGLNGYWNGRITVRDLAVTRPAAPVAKATFAAPFHNPFASRRGGKFHFLVGPSHVQFADGSHGSSSVGDFNGFDGVGKGQASIEWAVPGNPALPTCDDPAHSARLTLVGKFTVN